MILERVANQKDSRRRARIIKKLNDVKNEFISTYSRSPRCTKLILVELIRGMSPFAILVR